MTRKISEEEVNRRISVKYPYRLAGAFVRKSQKVMVFCEKHNQTHLSLVGNLELGCRIKCCADADGVRNAILDRESAAQKIASHHGYILRSDWFGYEGIADCYCQKHDFEQSIRGKHAISGQRLACCHKEHMKAVLSVSMSGAGNNFYGKRHSDETKKLLSEQRLGPKHPMFGKPRPRDAVEKTRAALLGRPRSDETKKKLRDFNLSISDNFEHCILKAASGKTAGKRGWFYVARLMDGRLKFGSTAVSIQYRAKRLEQVFGSASIIVAAEVDDAGVYESEMMIRHKSHWIRGEYFRDFLGCQDAKQPESA